LDGGGRRKVEPGGQAQAHAQEGAVEDAHIRGHGGGAGAPAAAHARDQAGMRPARKAGGRLLLVAARWLTLTASSPARSVDRPLHAAHRGQSAQVA